ncbi:MAG: ISL3 family transposase [Bacilli bacterium]|nr:ISL3 family transposase [Bacilli bacterium]
MDFNTLLLRLGINPNNFTNKDNEPIPIANGFLYDVEQSKEDRSCPYCRSQNSVIYGYYYTETNCSESENIIDILRIKRVRFLCKECGKTFSPKIEGIARYATISNQVERFIINDFIKPLTFEDIAKRYGLTKQRIIQLFDSKVKYVPRRNMPRILCIDEIKFSEELNQNYCCILYDFEKKEIVDIIRNRKMDYLREYFSSISLKERSNTKVFISDMYDGYATICRQYFPHSTHIVDKFHVITQLSRAVNNLRVMVMNSIKDTKEDEPYYNFMKSNWKLYLGREEDVPDKRYTFMKTGEVFHYDELLYGSLRLNEKLWTGYLALQDLLHHNYYSTFDETLDFIMFLSQKLKNAKSELLIKVGDTYHKWRYEIANAFTKEAKENRWSNSIAECINNQLKTIIKSAYGYHNFERFRKRAMMIITYSKNDI